MVEVPLTSPAAERNKGPILTVLSRVLPAHGLVLEIASGTGQHVVHFAEAMPHLTWQPSDPDPELRASIRAWIAQTGVSNVQAPLDLDVCRQPWAVETADAMVCINMIHIAPWAATTALMAGAARLLPQPGCWSSMAHTGVRDGTRPRAMRRSTGNSEPATRIGAFATWRP